MRYPTDDGVDAYIAPLPRWQQAICQDVRELVHDADPEVIETTKRKGQPYFVLAGNICALLAAKDHVNVFLYDGGIAPTLRASSRAGTPMRQRGPLPSAKASRSTRQPSLPCSARSSTTTGSGGGAS